MALQISREAPTGHVSERGTVELVNILPVPAAEHPVNRGLAHPIFLSQGSP